MSIQIDPILRFLEYILPRDKSFEQLDNYNSILYRIFEYLQGRLFLQILANAAVFRSMCGN